MPFSDMSSDIAINDSAEIRVHAHALHQRPVARPDNFLRRILLHMKDAVVISAILHGVRSSAGLSAAGLLNFRV
jgi:hypothetical protein